MKTRQHFLNLYYATLGFLTGIIGNIWVYYFSKWLEKRYPSLDWNWAFYVSTILFALWLFFWIRFIFRGLRRCTSNTEKNKTETDKEEEPEKNSLIAEYHVLNDTVNRRYRDLLLLESTVIPISLAVVTLAIIYRKDLGASVLIDLPIAFFIPLVGFILVLLLYLTRLTTVKINHISFERMNEIEKLLHIKGHRYTHERVRCKLWFKARWLVWHFIFFLIMGTYLFITYWLLREIKIG